MISDKGLTQMVSMLNTSKRLIENQGQILYKTPPPLGYIVSDISIIHFVMTLRQVKC